jgi:hypothetical protein
MNIKEERKSSKDELLAASIYLLKFLSSPNEKLCSINSYEEIYDFLVRNYNLHNLKDDLPKLKNAFGLHLILTLLKSFRKSQEAELFNTIEQLDKRILNYDLTKARDQLAELIRELQKVPGTDFSSLKNNPISIASDIMKVVEDFRIITQKFMNCFRSKTSIDKVSVRGNLTDEYLNN